jgi:2',3'-cyclic-nucleotide 2'-phosphodiesterase (5'-nucleotidase family)
MVGGMEALSHYINALRADLKNVLLIDGGDLMTGTLVADMEYKNVRGGAMVEFMNRLGYDVMGLGNHEFDLGQDNTLKLVRLARYPWLVANIIYQKNGQNFPVPPYHIFERAGLKVGVIAVMEENFLTEVHKERIEGLAITPIVTTLNDYIKTLDNQTDLIVVLVHSVFEDGLKIAREVGGIDVVLVASEDGRFEEVDGVLVKSTWGHQRTLGLLKLEVEQDKVVRYEEDLIWLWADMSLEASPEVSTLVQEIERSLKEEYVRIIGTCATDLNKWNYPIHNSPGELILGNWIADVMRWKTGTQIGLTNTGGIRAGLDAGPITRAEIFNICPFHNTLFVFELTTRQMKEILERDVERGKDRLQVSGLRYKYYPVGARPYGKRVHEMEVNGTLVVKEGRVLWPDKIFTVVSNDYVVGQAQEKYFGFPVTESYDTGFILDLVLMEWLEKHKLLDYKTEDRILRIIDHP